MQLVLALLAAAPAAAGARYDAKAVHAAAIVVDTHADTPQRLLDEGFDLGAAAEPYGHLDLEKMRAGNLTAEFFSIWVDPDDHKGRFAHRAFALIDAVPEQVRAHPGELALCTNADEIVAAKKAKKHCALMGVEGGHAIENDLGILRDFHRLGVRYMTLTWANTNEWADSSGDINKKDVVHHGGLTDFGKQVVAEMNRLGMLVDISHVSDKTFFDAVAVSKAPVIASHSSARALTPHARNLTDEMLQAVAKNGGVVQVNFAPMFIDDAFRKAWDAGGPERKKAQEALTAKLKDADPKTRERENTKFGREQAIKLPRPKLSALIDHIDHIAKVAGVDHVGLGSDFDGIPWTPEGVETCADLPRISEALAARGWSKQDLEKFLGGNMLRVMREAEKVAAASR